VVPRLAHRGKHFFEMAVAMAIALRPESGAALATVVGVLMEVLRPRHRYEQQLGPQHGWDTATGLVARTNALMNLPSTESASAGSRPEEVRKLRASSAR
jgi:hypothetical protein